MGSPESEAWRSNDETQHSVTVDDFYLSPCEVTQYEYRQVMGANPSSFIGENLPVEMVSWLDAVNYCNTRSEKEGLEPAYEIGDGTISWNRSASGYRLPTEAEWEYACRAGTVTPFNTQTSISAEEANYWGDYPYMIEDNYFSQGNLETKPREMSFQKSHHFQRSPLIRSMWGMLRRPLKKQPMWRRDITAMTSCHTPFRLNHLV